MRERRSPFANVIWFEKRKPKRGNKRASPNQIAGIRLHELALLLQARYGQEQLPDDDSGRDDIEPVLHHLAAMRQPVHRAQHWLEQWAPWLSLEESAAIIAVGITQARAWTADKLAWRYRVTREERTRLGLTTIGAIDFGKGARTKRRRQRDRQRKAVARRAQGLKPRTEYKASAVNRAKPWIDEGISRATWYRRRKAVRQRETSPATP